MLFRSDQAGDQTGLEQAAEQRGLPISVVPLPVTDDSGNLLPRESLLEMAHRYGAEQLLMGRPPVTASPPPASAAPGSAAPVTTPRPPAGAAPTAVPAGTTQPLPAVSPPAAPPAARPAAPAAQPAEPPEESAAWQWTLYTDFSSQSWSGPLIAGIDDTVDLLAPPPGAAAADAPGDTEIEIDGVSSLADYANIELMLGAVPGVSKANVRQVSGESVLFDLTVRGGGAAIERALSGSPSFARAGPGAQGGAASGAPLVYRYRPG